MDIDEQELQREAVAFAKQYGPLLNLTPQGRQGKKFLLQLADFLNWYDLQRALK